MKSNKRIYTKYGDSGITNLLYGGLVSKSDLRCRGYGNIDEACSTIGLARALSEDNKVKLILKDLQHEMFVVGAELATAKENRDKLKAKKTLVDETMVEVLEKEIDFSSGLKLNGALSIATTKGRWQELLRQATTAQLFNVNVEILNIKQIKKIFTAG